jgi:valyl-tRNA synthetase
MLGDTAIAVHPEPARALDEAEAALREKLAAAPAKERAEIESQIESLRSRRQSILPGLVQLREMAERGVMVELPLTDLRIPLIADEWAKPELGSGCVKITPAHDANDWAVWERHKGAIEKRNVMNSDGTLNNAAPKRYQGLKMHTKAREAVVADMEALGLLVEVEDREIDLAHSDRSKTPIEPWEADQWFLDMHSPFEDGRPCLADLAINAVKNEQVQIVPDRYAKGYLDWLSEKRDWPIGRQLWWGHRIPVWSKTFPADNFTDAMKDTPVAEVELSDILNHDPLGNAHIYLKCNWERIAWDAQLGPVDGQATVFACLNCGCDGDEKTLEAAGFVQESDVLDTWFSSALWPHSTLGWPDDTLELRKFYPTRALVTSRDIITLWVARMVLAGLYNMEAVPFREVYITPKILDGYGETMSKSKGNGVDPLDIIEKFGADALRFGIAYLTTDTQDVKLPVEFECPHCQAVFSQTKKNRQLPRIECENCGKPFSTQWAEKAADKALARGAVVSERFELGRNFCNKLWNAARFSLINLEGYTPGPVRESELLLEDRWLLSRLATVTEAVTECLENYRFADAARTLYDFAWNEFCSFYIEITKARLGPVAESRRDSDSRMGEMQLRNQATAQRVLAHALDVLMRLLHPMIPFLTEEVWHLLAKVAPSRGIPQPREADESDATGSICIAPWPIVDRVHQDATNDDRFADFQAVLGFLRETRQTRNIPQKEELTFAVRCDASTTRLLQPMQPYFTQMARAAATAWGPDAFAPDVPPTATLAGQHGPIEVHVDLTRFIDVATERRRLEKERVELLKYIDSIDKKLANRAFVERAPAEVVEQQRDKLAELRQQSASVEATLQKLGG